MSFFLDVFNKLLKINKNEIIIIFDINGDIWFGLKDIIRALGYKSLLNTYRMDIPKKYILTMENIDVSTFMGIPNKIQLKTKMINEPGLNYILSTSRKPLAKLFMDKYINEIMPQIRKTGKFILDNNNKIKLDIINQELYKIRQNNIDLLNNQRNVIYPIGNALYVIIIIKDNKKYYKIGYTRNLNKRLKIYNTSFPYKILFNYYVLVYDNNIDKCIKKIMRNEEFIKNKEYYKILLNKILKFITECDNNLDTICCGYCLKCYNFNKIKIHKCKYI